MKHPVELRVKATVSRDHKLSADVPEAVPVGECEVVLLVPARPGPANQRDRILAAFKRAAEARTGPEPSREELDQQIQQERDSWE
jgi:hypothetical protein